MKGVRFYRDALGNAIDLGFHRKTAREWQGLALFPANRCPDGSMEALGSVTSDPGDGPYCGTSVSYEYLTKQCIRISEQEARAIFPNLVATLED